MQGQYHCTTRALRIWHTLVTGAVARVERERPSRAFFTGVFGADGDIALAALGSVHRDIDDRHVGVVRGAELQGVFTCMYPHKPSLSCQ